MATVTATLYQFSMADVEDPELYAAQPLWEWQCTDYGQWCMEHCVQKPVFNIVPDMNTYGYRCVVRGQLEEQDYTFHQLKWSGYVNFNRR